MEEESKKTPKSSLSHGKKSNRSKGKLSKRNNSSISKRRKKKTLAKLVSQNSIHNVHCFPFPFADLFCGCGKDCGKDTNKIRKISSKTLSKIHKKERIPSIKTDEGNHEELLAVEALEVAEEKKETKTESPKITSEDAFALLTEPLDFDKLRLNGNMKNLLASVKFTSLFGCANVPKTMSQIKILLDNNPALKTNLRHILGDNLKNDNLKPVADLLASDVEEDVVDSSNDSSIRRLSISKSVMERKGKCEDESVDSSFILSRNGDDGVKKAQKNESRDHGSYNCSRHSHRKCSSHRSDASESQMSLFAKIFSSVFRSTKPSRTKHKKTKSRDTKRDNKKNFPSGEIMLDADKMKEMREKYDEWYERSPEEVRERFRWEDYVRVTMYLNDIKNAGFNNDNQTKEMLNLWLQKFSKEIHKHSVAEIDSDPIIENENESRESIALRSTLKRLVSEEMLNAGGGDVICRLNMLMKELVAAAENGEEKDHGDSAGDVEENINFSPDQPGCSKWFNSESKAHNNKKSGAPDDMSLYQTMCASFIDKLSKHGSKENKSIMGSRYTSEIPWQNKDFQVFCVPSIQTQFNLDNLRSVGDYKQEENLVKNYGIDDESSNYISRKSNGRGSVHTHDSRSYYTDRSEEVSSISGYQNKNEDIPNSDSKISPSQKRVSFNDEAVYDSSSEKKCYSNNILNGNGKEYSKLNESTSTGSFEQKGTSSDLNADTNASYPFPSNVSDLSYILEHNDPRYKSSRESINYIKDHKCELVGILKYLLSLASQDSNPFKPSEVSEIGDIKTTTKPCVGIQCTISEENPKRDISPSNLGEVGDPSRKFPQILVKSFSEIGPRKVGSESESLDSDSVKLIASLSDSGVHSNSSTSSRRQFISLPDVLEGAPVVLEKDANSGGASKQENDSAERKDSSTSNLLESCLSTSVSCQASQTPDMDGVSQVSTSDLSISEFKVLETRSSTNFNDDPDLRTTSSEKSRSSENTRSCPEMQETKAPRYRFKNIFRRISVKEPRK